MTTLQDLIKAVSFDMSLQVSALVADQSTGFNTELHNLNTRDMPVLFYDLGQTGNYDIRDNEKVYLVYNTTFLFCDFSDGNRLKDQTKFTQLQKVAIEFVQRLQRQEAFKLVPENTRLEPTFTELPYQFDAEMLNLSVSFTISIDPSVETPPCANAH